MREQPSTHLLTSIVAGVLSITTVGCSKDSGRTPTLESAASAATPQATVPDTPPAVQKAETAATAQTAAPKPVGHPVPMRRRATARPTATSTPASTQATPVKSDSAAAPAAPADAPAQAKWLSYDAATNTVTFELIAGPFTFNGYRNGEGTLSVPPKANMVINFVNKDGTPHSAIVISGDGPIPNSADTPAIPRAYTNKALEGLPQEATDVMRFPVPESGSYRIFCGVPGHGLSGMWIWLKIDPAAKTPSFGATKG
jgi:hypothetical protein